MANAPIATRITSTATTMPPMMVCCLRSFSICSARAFIAAASAALRSARVARFCVFLFFTAIQIPFEFHGVMPCTMITAQRYRFVGNSVKMRLRAGSGYAWAERMLACLRNVPAPNRMIVAPGAMAQTIQPTAEKHA